MDATLLGAYFLPNKDDRSYVTDVIVVLNKTALTIILALSKEVRGEHDITNPWERALALLSIEPEDISTATSLAST